MLSIRWLGSLVVAAACSIALANGGAIAAHVMALAAGDFQTFVKHVQTTESIAETQRETLLHHLAQVAAEPAGQPYAVTAALIEMYPAYRDALAAVDHDNEERVRQALRSLVDSDDPFLAADAAFFLARELMMAQRYEEALPLLNQITEDWANHSFNVGPSRYYAGLAYAGVLENNRAVDQLIIFLRDHSDAPERLRVAAWRQVQELQAIEEGGLSDVVHRMEFSRRRLENADTGATTQEQQRKIVDLLAELIREEEKKECGNCSGNTQEQGEQQQQQQGESGQDAGSSGGQSNNPNDVVRRTFDEGPASPWSRLRDRARDPANTAIKDRLPARYRDVVQRYYDAARGAPDDR